ncbi:MAG: UDP-N-acetylglucosamine 2-epimerase [Salinivirgaceae bacterium]|jgi:GDP/UDP-N,N'-diacetylbacillosamine 2-epimerase (hydrolysing)|nr:UDP-N-acetylglucosamine 2-epimerase [Salinivirgaceae bacterium]
MKTIAFFTTTRAEFGILSPFIRKIAESEQFNYQLFVGGAHLLQAHGNTLSEIKQMGFKPHDYFPYAPKETSKYHIAVALAEQSKAISKLFESYDFDYVCLLGDRIELLPIVQTAIVFKKLIIHLHGGEITEGAIDEQVRHMITKAAHIHFVAGKMYGDNLVHMGEETWRVFNTGALAVDNMIQIPCKEKAVLFATYGLNPERKTALLTYHPVTLENKISHGEQLANLFSALDKTDLQIMITAPNLDDEGDILRKIIQEKVDDKKYFFTASLGMKNYLSFMKHAELVIGNSSSGIIEAPYFKIPTINIGQRQSGRYKHCSIIDVVNDRELIFNAINHALSEAFQKKLINMEYEFGNGDAADNMHKALLSLQKKDDLLIKKLMHNAK